MALDEVKNCPFCSSNIDGAKFDESENFLAIYNIAPILPGHSLIVPKRHVESLMDLDDKELNEMMMFSRDTTKILLDVFKGTGFDWTVQEGEEAGQSVPHLHMHLIPRKPKDLSLPGDWYPLVRESEIEIIDSNARHRLSAEEMDVIVSKIREFVTRKK
jgi:bis(5'-adenosyl)-triphosphatase